MKIRMVEVEVEGINQLCPYVVCEGCNILIEAKTNNNPALRAIVLTKVEGYPAYHEPCGPSHGQGIPWRFLDVFLYSLQNNSGDCKLR